MKATLVSTSCTSSLVEGVEGESMRIGAILVDRYGDEINVGAEVYHGFDEFYIGGHEGAVRYLGTHIHGELSVN